MEEEVYERKSQALRSSWKVAASTIPAALLFGEVFRGTLSSNEWMPWMMVVNLFLLVLLVQLFSLRLLRSFWLTPWKKPTPPSTEEADRLLKRAVRYLILTWTMSAIQALMAFILLLFSTPRMYPYFFVGVALAYMLIFYPRPRFFAELLPDPSEQSS